MLNFSSIRNIIFDLGGVIIDIDTQKSINEFVKLGFTDFKLNLNELKENSIFSKFGRGELSADFFRSKLKKFLQDNITDRQIDYAWNSMLSNLPQKRLEILQKLSSDFRLFLLSNTNEIHHEQFANNRLERNFEKVYYSHLMGCEKPDAKIYKIVLEENGLVASETLFIDDTPKNTDAAKKLGIQVITLIDNDITNIFRKYNTL